jgi:spore maturation protein CgeB
VSRPWRILVVDSEARYSVGASFHRGFLALGHESAFFDQVPWVGGWSSHGRLERLVRTAARPVATAALNFALLAAVMAKKPDLVLVLKGNYLLPETIEAMRRSARFIVSYHTDDFENPLNTNESMRRSIPLWDVLFTPRSFVGDELRARGARRYEPLPFAYDPLLSHPAPRAPLPEPGIDASAVFVGTCAPERIALFEPIAARWPLRIWGGSWEKVPKASPLGPALRFRHLLDEPLCAVLSQAAISLALLRKGNRDRHTMRTFEIPACGGFMLAERSDEHRELFEEGREAAFFEGAEELSAQLERYLYDAPARRSIAAAGHRRVTTGGHRYQDRAARMLAVVQELQ